MNWYNECLAFFIKMEEQIEVQNVHVCKIKLQGHTNVKMLPTPLYVHAGEFG